MKKAFIAMLCLSLLAGCNSSQQESSSASEKAESEPAKEAAAESIPEITLEELKSYLTYHEVTADNWETIFSHGIQKDYEMDAFKEITDNYYVDVMLQLNEEYALTQDYVMRLHVKASVLDYGLSLSIDNDKDKRANAFTPLKNDVYPESSVRQLYLKRGIIGMLPGNDKYKSAIDDYTLQFVKAIGSAVTINIPEDIWTVDEKTGKRFFTVVYSEEEEEVKRKLYEDGSWVILKNGTVIDRFDPKDKYYEWPDDPPVNYLINAGWQLFDLINQ